MRRLPAFVPFVVALCVVSAHAAAAPRAGTGAGAGALVWGNGVFVTQPAFARWLSTHALSYPTWARLHPAGRRILVGAASLPIRFRPSQQAPTTSPPEPLAAGGGSTGSGPLLAALGLLAAVLMASALFPVRRLIRRLPILAFVEHRRLLPAVAGLAIAVGIAAAKLAG